ncbi:MAG: histidine kinase N-terminal 7TM domain-containing protein [Ruminococcus sp.]
MKVLSAVYIFSIISMTAEILWILARGQRSRQMFTFVACQFFLNIWSVSQLLILESVNSRQLFLSYCIGNTGICFIGASWLLFACSTAGVMLPKWLKACIFLFSAAMWTASLTNPLHGLFYTGFSLPSVEHGILFYANILFIYACIISGTVILCANIRRGANHRKITALLILSAVIPLISNILSLIGVISTRYDVTPLAFSMSSIFLLLATNRYGFLNVNELAFDKALDVISDGVAVFGTNGSMTYSSSAMRSFFGISEEIELADFYMILGTEHAEKLSAPGSFIETELVMDSRRLRIRQYRILGKNGNTLAVTFVVSDITRYYDEILREQELSSVKERLAIESERNRIAQEVHDTAGHTLTMINSLARLISVSLDNGNPGKAAEYSEEAQELSSQGIAQLRLSINNLRKKSEISLITDGLRQLADSVRGMETALCIQGEDSQRYSFCSNTIYENTRETITNALKYSGASRMDIIVKLRDSSAEVYIMDNGKGCGSISDGNGLRGMRERTEKIGGSIEFRSSEGCGFTTVMKFPIAIQ